MNTHDLLGSGLPKINFPPDEGYEEEYHIGHINYVDYPPHRHPLGHKDQL